MPLKEHMNVYISICTYIYMCTRTHTHTHTHKKTKNLGKENQRKNQRGQKLSNTLKICVYVSIYTWVYNTCIPVYSQTQIILIFIHTYKKPLHRLHVLIDNSNVTKTGSN